MRLLALFLGMTFFTAAQSVASKQPECENFAPFGAKNEGYDQLNEAYQYVANQRALKKLIQSGTRSALFFEINRLDARHLAAITGNAADFFALMEKNPAIDAPDRFLRNLLHYAALGGNPAIVSYLLGQGADGFATDRFDWNSFDFAVFGDSIEVMDLLITHGGRKKDVPQRLIPTMFKAVRDGNLPMVHYLQRAGVPLASLDENGENIYDGVDAHHAQLLNWLLENKVGFTSAKSVHSLIAKVAESNEPALASLLGQAFESVQPDWRMLLLDEAISHQSFQLILSLLDQLDEIHTRQLRVFANTGSYYENQPKALEQQWRTQILRKMADKGATLDVDILEAVARRRLFDVARLFMERGAVPNTETLTSLARSGDIALVEAAVSRGAVPDGDTLHEAALSGNLQLFSSLVQRFHLNVSTRQSQTRSSMLQSAILGNNPEMVQYLVEQGERPSPAKDKRGWNDFHTLLSVCNEQTIQLLTDRFNLYLNDDYRDAETYLLAAEYCSSPIVDKLLRTRQRGDIERIVNGSARLGRQHLAVAFEHMLQNRTLWGEQVIAAAQLGLLAIAVYSEDHARIEAFMPKFPSVEAVKAQPQMATDLLIGAIEKENYRVVCYLLHSGVSVNGTGSRGGTPLMAAVRGENIALLSHLIDKGADVNAHGENGTVLWNAAHQGNLALFQTLLSRGAIIDDPDGLFFEAASRGNLDIVKYLVEQTGADVNAIRYGRLFVNDSFELYRFDGQFLRVVEYALLHGLNLNFPQGEPIVHFLLQQYAHKPEKTLWLLDYFVRKGASMSVVNAKGQSPLFAALTHCFLASKRFEGLIAALRKNGARLDDTGPYGQSLLAEARALHCDEQNVAALERLGAKTNGVDRFNRESEQIFNDLQLGVDNTDRSLERLRKLIGKKNELVNAPNREGETLLHLACQSGNGAMVNRLLSMGAQPEVTDASGNTPLYFALAYSRNLDVARALVASGAVFPQDIRWANMILTDALMEGRMDIVAYLNENGLVLRIVENERDRKYQLQNMQRELLFVIGSGYFASARFIVEFLVQNGSPREALERLVHSALQNSLQDPQVICDKEKMAAAKDFVGVFASKKLDEELMKLQTDADCTGDPFHMQRDYLY